MFKTIDVSGLSNRLKWATCQLISLYAHLCLHQEKHPRKKSLMLMVIISPPAPRMKMPLQKSSHKLQNHILHPFLKKKTLFLKSSWFSICCIRGSLRKVQRNFIQLQSTRSSSRMVLPNLNSASLTVLLTQEMRMSQFLRHGLIQAIPQPTFVHLHLPRTQEGHNELLHCDTF